MIQANMLMDDLLSYVKGIPLKSGDWVQFVLSDGHLLVKSKIDNGKERIADWKFEPL